ncbi:MAG: hypothetical protein ACYC0B_03160 [Gemmatimonadaceae bacterium]
MTHRSVLLGLVALIAATTNGVHSRVSVEADVYAALLDSIGLKPIPDTLLVGDSSLQFRAPAGGVASWRTQFDSIPSELPRRLEVASQSRIPSLALALPRPAKVVTPAELREIFATGPGGWAEFYRRYPKQRSYIRLSPVAFSDDSLNALVYYEYHCGGLRGGGDAVWLARLSSTSRWHVRKRVGFWVS